MRKHSRAVPAADIYGVQGGQAGITVLIRAGQQHRQTGTVNWNAGAGFAPIGSVTTAFTGNFNGRNNTIANLTINRPGTAKAGLLAYQAERLMWG